MTPRKLYIGKTSTGQYAVHHESPGGMFVKEGIDGEFLAGYLTSLRYESSDRIDVVNGFPPRLDRVCSPGVEPLSFRELRELVGGTDIVIYYRLWEALPHLRP